MSHNRLNRGTLVEKVVQITGNVRQRGVRWSHPCFLTPSLPYPPLRVVHLTTALTLRSGNAVRYLLLMTVLSQPGFSNSQACRANCSGLLWKTSRRGCRSIFLEVLNLTGGRTFSCNNRGNQLIAGHHGAITINLQR